MAGKVSNVNGGIALDAAHVGGGIETTSGDIDVGANSRVEGGILVNQDNSWFHFGVSRDPRIVIGPHAVVKGDLVFKRTVQLYVSDSATVGKIDGAKAIPFTATSRRSSLCMACRVPTRRPWKQADDRDVQVTFAIAGAGSNCIGD